MCFGKYTLNVYAPNGNLILKFDDDVYVARFAYDPRNLVKKVNCKDTGTGSLS